MQSDLSSNSVGQAQLKTQVASVAITSGSASGTASVTAGAIIMGWYPSGNLDQIVKNISISGTTVTVTLLTNATLDSVVKVVVLRA